jgi:hypothetical protein
VEVDGRRWFVKVPVEPRAAASLRRAVAVHAVVRHPAIIPLARTMSSDLGPALVYPWVDGDLLHGADGALGRFKTRPLWEVLSAVESIFEAHVVVAAAGFVSVDLYDGCFIYDFDRGRMWVCDLDEYRPGPFRVEGDRLPGSRRFMAPEELQSGAVVNERTTVFHLGRTAAVLLDDRCPEAADDVVARATAVDPALRHATVAGFVADWHLVIDRTL